MNLLYVLLFSGLLISCQTKNIDSCGFNKDITGDRISHKTRPIQMYIHDSVPLVYRDLVIEAANLWKDSREQNIIIIPDTLLTGPITGQMDGKNVIYFIDTRILKGSRNLGYASVFSRGSYIVESDIYINLTEDPELFKRVLVHEMGHALGLNHIDDADSIMSTIMGDINSPTELDINNIRCEY